MLVLIMTHIFCIKLLIVFRADADGDGLITKEEWFEVLTKAGKKVTRWVGQKGMLFVSHDKCLM